MEGATEAPSTTCHSKSNRTHSRLSAAPSLSFTRTASNFFHRAGFVFSPPCSRRALRINLPNSQYCMKSHNAPPQYHSGPASPTFYTLPQWTAFVNVCIVRSYIRDSREGAFLDLIIRSERMHGPAAPKRTGTLMAPRRNLSATLEENC